MTLLIWSCTCCSLRWPNCICPSSRRALSETKWNRHDPQSPYEDPKNDPYYCCLLCHLLDAVLPPWNLVLVPATDAASNPWLCSSCLLCFWKPQHMLRSSHLWLLYTIIPCWLVQMFLLEEPECFSQFPGTVLWPQARSQWGSRVRLGQWWPTQWTTSINDLDSIMFCAKRICKSKCCSIRLCVHQRHFVYSVYSPQCLFHHTGLFMHAAQLTFVQHRRLHRDDASTLRGELKCSVSAGQ